METHFTTFDLSFLFTGLLLVIASVAAFTYGKHRLALLLLVAGGFTLRLLMAFIDPFVHIWDEQFHAMVARNMTEHFFEPTLYEHPALPSLPESWGLNHIWVHKPPLFLWQIAGVMKITGPTVWAVRLPSVLLSTLLLPVIYRMGNLLSGKTTAYVAALLFCVSNLQVNVVSGFLNTDHNDVVFMCYVIFSFWTWMEYRFSSSWKWIVLTGLFSGMAILVKWLPGLLVFGAWGLMLLADSAARRDAKAWKALLGALCVTVLVAAPWFICIYVRWPQETAATMALNSRHLSEPLSHPGPWYYHFAELKEGYGWWLAIVLPVALFFFIKRNEQRPLRWGSVGAIVVVYAFYSFVQTRMPLFCLVVSPLLLLVAGELIGALIARVPLKARRVLLLIGLPCFAFFFLDIGRLEHYHTGRDPHEVYRTARMHNRAAFEQAAKQLPPGCVLFNCGGYANGVACMFYTGVTAYSTLPEEEQFQQLKTNRIPIAVFDDAPIPAFMAADTTVIRVHGPLMRNGF